MLRAKGPESLLLAFSRHDRADITKYQQNGCLDSLKTILAVEKNEIISDTKTLVMFLIPRWRRLF